jgi:YspA, cpYpsA-related SLOG family
MEVMRVIIAGSRDIILSFGCMYDVVQASGLEVTSVVCGMARGVDRSGRDWAHALSIPVHEFPADWDKYGKRAGYRRNEVMADNADALIAVTNGSRGTGHMIDIARAKGLKVFVKEWSGP